MKRGRKYITLDKEKDTFLLISLVPHYDKKKFECFRMINKANVFEAAFLSNTANKYTDKFLEGKRNELAVKQTKP